MERTHSEAEMQSSERNTDSTMSMTSLEPDPVISPTTTTSSDIELAAEASPGVDFVVERKRNQDKCCLPFLRDHFWHILVLAVIWILHTIPIVVFYAIDTTVSACMDKLQSKPLVFYYASLIPHRSLPAI